MVVLLANDFHAAKDNMKEFEKNWEEMLSVCKRYGVDHVFIAGDLFDSPTAQSRIVMVGVKRCLQKAVASHITIDVAPGNHDIENRNVTDSWLDVFDNVVNVHKSPQLFKMGELWLAMFPYYLEDTIFPKQLKEFEDEIKSQHIERRDIVLYLHAGVHGALGDFDVPNELSQEILAPYHKVLCAHYHNRTHIKNTNVWYIGSSRQHSFGEDEEKGYTLLHSDGMTEFVKNEVNARYVTEDLSLHNLKKWKNNYDERYKVRLVVHCKDSEVDTVDKQVLLEHGANKICFDTEKIQAIKAEQSGINDKFDARDLQQEYKSFCDEKDLDDKMGIKYLSEI